MKIDIKKFLAPPVIMSGKNNQVKEIGAVVKQATSVIGQSICEDVSKVVTTGKDTARNLLDDAKEFTAIKIKAMLSTFQFEDTLKAIDKYQSETGKNAENLRKFIVKLQEFLQDGKQR